MAFDFPNSPTDGQTFAPSGGPTYIYRTASGVWELLNTGTGLAEAPLDTFTYGRKDAAWVRATPVTGGVMSGGITFDYPNPAIAFEKSTASGEYCGMFSTVNGVSRWGLLLGDGSAESGTRTGCDFVVQYYNNSGGFMGNPLSISRLTGVTNLNGLVCTNAANFESGLTTTSATINGAIAATTITTSGTISGGGAMSSVGTLATSSGRLMSYHATIGAHPSMCVYNTAQGVCFGMYVHTDNTLSWGAADGTGVPTTQLMKLDGAGNFTINGVTFFSADTTYYTGYSAGTKYFSWATGYYWGYNTATGNLDFYANSASRITVNATNGYFYANVQGSKPGGGVWADSSDARIKTVEGDYTRGLDAVAALRPILYTFKGNDTIDPPAFQPQMDEAGQPMARQDAKEAATIPYENSPHYQAAKDARKFTGLIAQEVEPFMPEMVKKTSGYIDGVAVTDLHDLDTTPLIFALINSIKELKARVEALEAAA